MKGRCRYVYNQPGAHLRLNLHRAARNPDVLADVDAGFYSLDAEEKGFFTGCKIPLLIKNVVVRQVDFVLDSNKLAIMDNSCGVMEAAVRNVDEPENGR